MDMISSISLEESSISLTINWVPVYPNSPCAQVYKVYHTHDISGATISDIVSRNVTTKTLTRLRENDWYTVRVMAVFNDGSVSRNVSNRGRTLTSGTMWFEIVTRNEYVNQCDQLTWVSVLGKMLVHLLHALHVDAAHHDMVDHWQGVLLSHNALGSFLDRLRCVPWFMDVACWEVLQDRQRSRYGNHVPYVVSVGVCLAPKAHRAVAVEELLKERGATEPHPHAGIDGPVRVKEQLVKHLLPFLPRHPQVSSGEKAGHGMTCQMVDPPLFP
uniref:Fibronectin type-III domain-containing protein n=1 Tax=Timema cristinae TaxID=61476 RepID=A0A7R9H3S0_TIMCR|nr:unnamed protein product [Timema cristinae]